MSMLTGLIEIIYKNGYHYLYHTKIFTTLLKDLNVGNDVARNLNWAHPGCLTDAVLPLNSVKLHESSEALQQSKA